MLPIFGVPRKVISDRGPQFTSEFWSEILRLLGAQRALATAHHPQTDGQSERSVQVLIKLLRTYSAKVKAEWEDLLPCLELAVNATPNELTKTAPAEVVLGRVPRLPMDFALDSNVELGATKSDNVRQLDDSQVEEEKRSSKLKALQERLRTIHRLVEQHQAAAAAKAKRFYNKGRSDLQFEPGDWVVLDVRSFVLSPGERKQNERFTGPYVVKRRIHQNTYELSGLLPHLPKVQNVQFLHRFNESMTCFEGRPETPYARPEATQEGSVEWEVEAILKKKDTAKGRKYLVKWKNWPRNQWIPRECLTNCAELLESFEARQLLESVTRPLVSKEDNAKLKREERRL